jgi:hypothetical protein
VDRYRSLRACKAASIANHSRRRLDHSTGFEPRLQRGDQGEEASHDRMYLAGPLITQQVVEGLQGIGM